MGLGCLLGESTLIPGRELGERGRNTDWASLFLPSPAEAR